MKISIFDERTCSLGEGPLWHPEREEFFWFDINSKKLLSVAGREWQFDEFVSAAGWIDRNTLLVATDRSLARFDIDSGELESVCAMDADDKSTRSNDGRADPFGGFWIGTMPLDCNGDIGAIQRYYRGELRVLYHNITIPNSICFSPDGFWAYWTDTANGQIWKQALDQVHGWPKGDPEPFANPKTEGWNPDGSVVDASGTLWNAQYGGSRIAAYGSDGVFRKSIELPALQPTCPAFGGKDLSTLICTTAFQGLGAEALAGSTHNGQVFSIEGMGPGQAEHQVVL